MASASPDQSVACGCESQLRAAARRPATQVSRLCVQAWLSISHIPASVSCQRLAIAPAAISAARQPSASQTVMKVGGRQQEQRLAQAVQLELPVHPVADQVEPAGITRQIQPALARVLHRR